MAFTICIDAGHAGKYNRSPVVPAYYESVMNWKISELQKKYLVKYKDVKVIMTRSSQAKDMDLISRGKKSKGCDLFISNHSNAESSGNATYALAIVMRENDRVEFDEISDRVGKRLVNVIGKVMGVNSQVFTKNYVGDRDGNGLQDDEWYGVLQGAKMVNTPGVILEHGFHTHKDTANWLLQTKNLEKLAKAEVAEIAKIFGLKKKAQKTTPAIPNSAEEKNTQTNTLKKKVGHIRVVYKGSDGLNVRTAPNTDSKVVRVLKYNAVENVLWITSDGNWYKTADGYYVSANKAYVKLHAFVTYKVKVEVTDLNMRTDAGINYDSAGKIPPGIYTIVSEKEGKLPNGVAGLWGQLAGNGYWIALQYVKNV